MKSLAAPTLLSLSRRRYRLIGLSFFTMIAIWLLPLTQVLAEEAVRDPGQTLLGQLQAWLVDTLTWIDSLGAIAPVAFIVLYILITVTFVPASVVTLGAGIIFGVLEGFLLVFVGAMFGAICAFLIGRYFARDWVSHKVASNPKFRVVDEAIAQQGRKIIFLLRLSPVFPFNLLNYALGLTKISLKDYILGNLGIIPGTLLYVYLGTLVGNLATLGTGATPDSPVITWVIRVLALVATMSVTVYTTRVAQNALSKSVPSITDNSNGTPIRQ